MAPYNSIIKIKYFAEPGLGKNSLIKTRPSRNFPTYNCFGCFKGPKKLNKIAKFRLPKTREKLTKLETAETTNDMQGLTWHILYEQQLLTLLKLHVEKVLVIVMLLLSPCERSKWAKRNLRSE